MTKIVWDLPSKRRYESGLDRGVLYPKGSYGVPWNGLTSVNEGVDDQSHQALHHNAKKRFDVVRPGDFSATLNAITYPDEFLEFDGVGGGIGGIFVDNQPRRTFDLSYRTMVGSAKDGHDLGYKIHILYNLTAEPSSITRKTLGAEVDPLEFSWSLKAVPVEINGYRPTAHFIVDSTKIYPDKLAQIEDILYGNDSSDPRMITPIELSNLQVLTVIVTDNGDGTWSIDGPEEYIYASGPDMFTLEVISIDYIDENSYLISSS